MSDQNDLQMAYYKIPSDLILLWGKMDDDKLNAYYDRLLSMAAVNDSSKDEIIRILKQLDAFMAFHDKNVRNGVSLC